MSNTDMQMSGSEIKAGDVLANGIDGGVIGDVLSVRPYTGALIDLLGQGTQIAAFYGGKEMTLPATSSYRVQRATHPT